MIEAFLNGIGITALNFGEILNNAFNSISNLFVMSVDGGFELTLLGSVTAIALGVSVLTFVIGLVMRIVKSVKLKG